MNKIIMLALIMFSTNVSASIKSAEIIASGLTCSMCSKSIYKALEKVPSIKSIDVNVEKSTFSIQFKEGVPVSLDEVKGAVEKAGFSVASMVVVASFTGEEVYNDAHVNIDGSTFHFIKVNRKKLSGDVAIRLIDKNYLTQKEHKKYSTYTAMKCFETGTKAPCCPPNASNRIYHVTI